MTADRHGLLRADKPVGMTSHDVVDLARRKLGIRSIGHVGTLDPGASGLLLLAVGAATRCVSVWQGGAKTYEGRIRFGVITDSQDLMGRVLEERPVAADEAEIRSATAGFVGEILQQPPMVSAVRVGGERLHRLARRGVTVDRPDRRVVVHSWEWLEFEMPEAAFRIRCGKGTYVRTLAHDLGQRLGCGAALAGLRRTRSEPFDLRNAVSGSELRTLDPEDIWRQSGSSLEEALAFLPRLILDAEAAEGIGFGRSVSVEGPANRMPAGGGDHSTVLTGPDGEVLALGELTEVPGQGWMARPRVVFPWAVRSGRRVVACDR